MNIRLLVLRASDPERLAGFYGLLGAELVYQRHGNSPYHYSVELGQTILEIYPLSKGQITADPYLRLGFGIENFDMTMQRLNDNGVIVSSEPTQTDFGFMAVVVDTDGRKVELYKI